MKSSAKIKKHQKSGPGIALVLGLVVFLSNGSLHSDSIHQAQNPIPEHPTYQFLEETYDNEFEGRIVDGFIVPPLSDHLILIFKLTIKTHPLITLVC